MTDIEQSQEEPVKISDICPLCKKVNKEAWVVASRAGKTLKICKTCFDGKEPPTLDQTAYERNKKRMAEERLAANKSVLRSYRIKH